MNSQIQSMRNPTKLSGDLTRDGNEIVIKKSGTLIIGCDEYATLYKNGTVIHNAINGTFLTVTSCNYGDKITSMHVMSNYLEYIII